MQLDAPRALSVPIAHGKHVVAPATLNLPAVHCVAAVAFVSATNEPVGDCVHAAAPVVRGWNEPGGHAWHDDALPTAKKPAPHTTGGAAPPAHALPSTHSVKELSPAVWQCAPEGHVRQLDALTPGWYVPMGQFEHAVAFCVAANVPAPQTEHTATFPALCEPGSHPRHADMPRTGV